MPRRARPRDGQFFKRFRIEVQATRYEIA
jgi:hypothetical protein